LSLIAISVAPTVEAEVIEERLFAGLSQYQLGRIVAKEDGCF
jgi:hypothetical protein